MHIVHPHFFFLTERPSVQVEFLVLVIQVQSSIFLLKRKVRKSMKNKKYLKILNKKSFIKFSMDVLKM